MAIIFFPVVIAGGSNNVISSLKEQLSDRRTLGLKSTRLTAPSPSLARMNKNFSNIDQGKWDSIVIKKIQNSSVLQKGMFWVCVHSFMGVFHVF